MTALQKEIIQMLFAGGNIAAYGNNFRLRDAQCNPVRSFTYKTWHPVRRLLRKEKSGCYVIDKKKVRKMHGRSWVKKYYKEQLKTL